MRRHRAITHDYRAPQRGFGHDYSYRPIPDTTSLKASGWGIGIQAGDYILLSLPTDRSRETRYQFGDDFEYMANPPDQWFATLHFAPRGAPNA